MHITHIPRFALDPPARCRPRLRPWLGSGLAAGLLAAMAALAVPAPLMAAEAPRVVATIKPVHALVASVMQGVGEPALLVSGAQSPHTYAMKPSDAKAVADADVVFRMSEQVEPFTRRLAATLSDKARLVTLAEAPGIAHLPLRKSDDFAAKGDPAHDHDHGHDHSHGEPASGAVDGHVWLDPANARTMVGAIEAALSAAAPEHATAFRDNARRLEQSLTALETDVANELAPVRDRPFVVFHDAYQYFERRFGLEAVGAITLSPDRKPSARRLSEIRREIGRSEARCVFAEPAFSPALVATVTEGTAAKSGTLDPEGIMIEPGAGAYERLLRKLATDLKSCLAG